MAQIGLIFMNFKFYKKVKWKKFLSFKPGFSNLVIYKCVEFGKKIEKN